jgi:hypothetical protein
MMSATRIRKRWPFIVPIVVAVCVTPFLCYYPLTRLNDYTECWENSCKSPAKLLAESDIVQLGVLTRYRHVGAIQYVRWKDTIQEDMTELVYMTAVSAKGNVDSVTVWTLGEMTPSRPGFQIGDTALVYGLRVSVPDSIVRITSYCSGSITDSLVPSSILASPNIMHELSVAISKMPVIVLTDGFRVFDSYQMRYEICYYDEERSPHCVTPSRYWKELLRAVKVEEKHP